MKKEYTKPLLSVVTLIADCDIAFVSPETTKSESYKPDNEMGLDEGIFD